MIGYLDSELFYLVFLGWLIGLCILNIIMLIFRRRNSKLSSWIIVIRFLLISSITVYIIDSIPYLFIDIYDVPLFNIILSNIFGLLLGVSSGLYLYINAEEFIATKKNIVIKKDINL